MMTDAQMTDAQIAKEIFERYLRTYEGEVQGCCPVNADEILDAIGGEVVAGELFWYGGACRRTHWWVEKDGAVIDPMGDWFLEKEVAPGRWEAHRDRYIFNSILYRYERWRLPTTANVATADGTSNAVH